MTKTYAVVLKMRLTAESLEDAVRMLKELNFELSQVVSLKEVRK